MVIENNIFTNQYYRAMDLISLQQPEIRGNDITSNTAYTSYSAIYIQVCSQPRVQRNKISFNAGIYGIYLGNCTGTVSIRGLIANNFVHIGGTTASYGMYSTVNTYQNFYYNSVNITNTATTSAAFYQSSTAGGPTSNCKIISLPTRVVDMLFM